MNLLGVALIFALILRPKTIEVDDDVVSVGTPRTRATPAPLTHVVTWAVVCVAIVAGMVTLGVLERL